MVHGTPLQHLQPHVGQENSHSQDGCGAQANTHHQHPWLASLEKLRHLPTYPLASMPSILPPVHPFLPSLHSIPLLIPMSHCCDRKKTLIIQRLSWLLSLNTLQEDTRGPADGGASPESASKVTVCHCPPAPASSASTSLSC